MAIPASILSDIQHKQGLRIQQSHPVSGGCIHHAHRIDTDQGALFVKYNGLDQAHNFEMESKGLMLLKDSNCVHVPDVITCDSIDHHAYLLLTFIESGIKAKNYWEVLGRNLGQLHRNSAPTFGLDYDNYIGSLAQSNRKHTSWIDFFIQERLQTMLALGEKKGRIPKSVRKQFDSLCEKLDSHFPQETPALIHGDLWGGNLMTNTEGLPVLIDPAVYYGHREIELAFMTLFDSQPPNFYQAYDEVYPLAHGWQERLDLYNLYPLLVHVNLFGGSYLSSVQAILNRYL